jgi:hypothetical protein
VCVCVFEKLKRERVCVCLCVCVCVRHRARERVRVRVRERERMCVVLFGNQVNNRYDVIDHHVSTFFQSVSKLSFLAKNAAFL